MNGAVLVLNQNYEPLNVCNVRRAIVLVFDGKAEVLEANGRVVKSATRTFPAPSVIRMIYLIHRPRPRVKLSRREVFIRDGYTCQYCGRQSHDLAQSRLRASRSPVPLAAHTKFNAAPWHLSLSRSLDPPG